MSSHLVKTAWPTRLAILLPVPAEVSMLAALASLGLLGGITCLALRAAAATSARHRRGGSGIR